MSRADIALKYFRENEDFMKHTVEANIEKYRKGKTSVTVLDKEGKPMKGVTVRFKQTSHAFKYGANIFMLDEFENAEKNALYRERFKEICNIATVPFYWSDLEPTRGKPRFSKDSERVYRRPPIDLCVEYCKESGVEPKCHCLNYDNFLPTWLKNASVSEHKLALDKRFRELAERYADVIPSWEVTNETLNADVHPESKFFKEDDFVEWSFRTAERYFPKNRLIINDYDVFERAYKGNRSAYYMQIERLPLRGVHHLDSIGIQFHSFFPQEQEAEIAKTRYNPVYLYRVFDKYAELGKRLQITEMTIPAFSSSEEDEYVQAEIVKNVYSVFFSHPAMEAIIYWNLVDGYAAFAPQGDMSAGENKYHGGFMRFDMSTKKVYDTVRDLFGRQWRTDVTVTTDECGVATFRGFYGDYDVTVSRGTDEMKTTLQTSDDRHNVTSITLS